MIEKKKEIMKAGHNYVNKRPRKSRFVNWIRPLHDIEIEKEMMVDFRDISVDEGKAK